MTTIPTTMKSVLVKENGGADKLIYEEVPVPKVSEGSVLASTLLTHIKEVGYTKYLCLTRLEEKVLVK
ncbi:hypothetical protein G6F16_013130 [Rhizopus arrhizus]|nr:hypothetical protein G6F24_013583 [Rhizopus arrhizus]KAG0778319.1 hypothetical protein G6F21_013036 [Rhizopus arrhizus]KAG0803966.1 hypothetical protein G6F20_013071 [Rhizopus arrhizus]KAG0814368.1 hypothetical protein G6F19_013126 [Rhizopus arrhizus]KAG0815142.1 hypothetical protein G6F18_013132 [Rhizopus arrhizus]